MTLPNRVHPDDARKDGYTIDESCYPWVAYKGERFRLQPGDWHYCFTNLESQMVRGQTRESIN